MVLLRISKLAVIVSVVIFSQRVLKDHKVLCINVILGNQNWMGPLKQFCPNGRALLVNLKGDICTVCCHINCQKAIVILDIGAQVMIHCTDI